MDNMPDVEFWAETQVGILLTTLHGTRRLSEQEWRGYSNLLARLLTPAQVSYLSTALVATPVTHGGGHQTSVPSGLIG